MKLVILLFVACAVCANAQPSPDLEKAELLRVHHLDREAHFKTDVEKLLEQAPEEFISVARGKITRSTKDDTRKFFTGYFRDAQYYEWDDGRADHTHLERRQHGVDDHADEDSARAKDRGRGGEGGEGRLRRDHDLRET